MDLTIHLGKVKGHFKNKENRVQKLFVTKEQLQAKLENMIVRGKGESDNAVKAIMTLLILQTGIRIGNEKSAEGYICDLKYHKSYKKLIKTFGLTTIQGRHIRIKGSTITIEFLGKKAVVNKLVLTSKFLSKVLRSYLKNVDKDEKVFDFNGHELTKFIKRYVGNAYSPKDLRALYANKLFIEEALKTRQQIYSKKDIKSYLTVVATMLGNTAAVCKRSYISSTLIDVMMNTQEEV